MGFKKKLAKMAKEKLQCDNSMGTFTEQATNLVQQHLGPYAQMFGQQSSNNPTLPDFTQHMNQYMNQLAAISNAQGSFNYGNAFNAQAMNPGMQSTQPYVPASNTTAPEPPDDVSNAAVWGPSLPKPVPGSGEASSVIPQTVLQQARARPHSARAKLGDAAVFEACKGLSRVVNPADPDDLQRFGTQLVMTDRAAIASDYTTADESIVFALSYVQYDSGRGRFKFCDEQWGNFLAAMNAIAACGVTQIRLWYDQCLWLRDVSQGSWAHIGMLPYAIWPVINLGVKRSSNDDRTIASYERFWPFVEEISALWGMGMLITRELRSEDAERHNTRRSFSYNQRVQYEPENVLEIVLHNIFHGAGDGLKTGWVEDVKQLQEMARCNIMYGGDVVVIGADWKSRLSGASSAYQVMQNLLLPIRVEYLGGNDVYLDGARKVPHGRRWTGLVEFLSGNEPGTPITSNDLMMVNISGLAWYNAVTDKGEFQILCRSSVNQALFLMAAMDGRSSNYSRGRVAWTKVLHGRMSSRLPEAISNANYAVIQNILAEQLPCSHLKLHSIQQCEGDIEWC